MKKVRVILSAFGILAIVAGTFAFKAGDVSKYFTSGSVYCNSTCPNTSRVTFRVDPSGLTTAPCGSGVQPYILTTGQVCTSTGTIGSTKFTGTNSGN